MEPSCPRCDRDHPRGAPECHGRRVGTVFAGKYRVIRVLGAGGMGVVFEVEQITLARRSALKLLLGHRGGDVAKERFRREAKRLGTLKSPGIVEVYDAGHDEEGTPYLEMELLSGASVEELLKGGPIEPARAAQIIETALAGLEVAHDAGVIHRDLKPDNLFVVGDPATSTRVKILDFGIAKGADEEALTREGRVLGTPYFMSPEQVKSSVGAGVTSDVYAMGATLFRCLTGAYPIEPGPPASIVAKIVTGNVSRNPRELVAAVPAWLDAIVARAMAHRPEDRYATARAMREAIAAAMTPATTEGDDDVPVAAPSPVEALSLRPIEAPIEAPIGAPSAAPVAARSQAPMEARIEAPARSVGAPATERATTTASSNKMPFLLAAGAMVLAGGAIAVVVGGSTGSTVTLSTSASAAAPSASVVGPPASAGPSRPAPLPGMVAIPGATVALGTLEAEQPAELARCTSALAIDPKDCTAVRIARETPRALDVRPFDLDALEVDNASFLAWALGVLASGKATIDAKGVMRIDGAPILGTGSQHAGIDAAGGSLKLRAGFARRPVVLVSWNGASQFCATQGKRLPSEAEWEAAARDGRKAEFVWGDEVPACEDVAFAGSAAKRCAIAAARDVGANPRDVTRTGVRDLGGNVMEWVDGPGDGDDTHPMRGGSWAGSAFEARVARRRFGKVAELLNDVGFRCAR